MARAYSKKPWTQEESTALIRGYFVNKSRKFLVKFLFDAGYDRDQISIQYRLHRIGLPGDPPMDEQAAIKESSEHLLGGTKVQSPSRSGNHYLTQNANERVELNCMCCGEMFGSWDRRKNRLCSYCRGGDELQEMSA